MTRNPLDSIATHARKDHHGDVGAAVDTFFYLCDCIQRVQDRYPELDWIEVPHEEFVFDTTEHLGRICRFLGPSPSEEYLADCASIVFDEPRQRRDTVSYTTAQLDRIGKGIREYDFLHRYASDFDDWVGSESAATRSSA